MSDRGPADVDRQYDCTPLLALMAIAVVVAGALVFIPHAKMIFNGSKAWELTTQFFLVVVLGGAVGFGYRSWEAGRADEQQRLEQERERRDVQRAELQKFYRLAVDLHHECKKIRRTLRATTIQDGKVRYIERRTFEQLMNRLEDAQLNAERMNREVALRKDIFACEKDRLSSHLSKIEKHLRTLLRDYEGQYAERREIEENALIKLDPALTEFIGHRGDNRNTPSSINYFAPAEDVRTLVLELMEKTTPVAIHK